MTVGSGAPPVNLDGLELGRMLEIVSSGDVVVRVDDWVYGGGGGGGDAVLDDVPGTAVLLLRSSVSSDDIP